MESQKAELYFPMMNQKLLNSNELHEKSSLVTPHMVRRRTVELAISDGRSAIEIKQRDYEQAKRELTGETDFDRQHVVLYGG